MLKSREGDNDVKSDECRMNNGLVGIKGVYT